MTSRLVIITEIISPYRIPLFNALAQQEDVDLHVIFLAETDPGLRQWLVYKEEIAFSYEVLPSWRRQIGRYNVLLNRGVEAALAHACPDVILCGGYNYVASWQALAWARGRGIPFFLWSESNLEDMRPGRSLIELLKHDFLQACTGFVVPGRAARDYLLTLGIRENRIFTAVNAVDNHLFKTAADSARRNASQMRSQLDLPQRYFLFVGRLVREKGVFELLSAYAKLDEALRQQIGVVFAGDGPCRARLEAEASSISKGTVRFVGFAQREQLAVYYGLAEMLILPTYSDTWGLVVNEAMACGLPIILSSAAGCGPDLITENWNGVTVPPRNISDLATAMQDVASRPETCSQMGMNSRERIRQYSPHEWAQGVARMVSAAGWGIRD